MQLSPGAYLFSKNKKFKLNNIQIISKMALFGKKEHSNLKEIRNKVEEVFAQANEKMNEISKDWDAEINNDYRHRNPATGAVTRISDSDDRRYRLKSIDEEDKLAEKLIEIGTRLIERNKKMRQLA